MPRKNPRDNQNWPVDLRIQAKDLGLPEAVFTTMNGGTPVLTDGGLKLLIVGISFNVLYWVLLNPANIVLPLKLVVLVGGLVPGLGLLALLYAWTSRGQWVLVYPTGLLIWKRGVVTTMPWEEIVRISFTGVRRFSTPIIQRDSAGQIETAWLPIEESVPFGYWKLRVRRNDGAKSEITEQLGNSEELCRLIQDRTFRLFWPAIREQLRKGEECSFGPLRLSKTGLTDDREELVPWEQIGSIRTDRSIQIRKSGRWYPWRTVRIWRIPNPHVLLALASTSSEWHD
jgi:hypothetical protein